MAFIPTCHLLSSPEAAEEGNSGLIVKSQKKLLECQVYEFVLQILGFQPVKERSNLLIH